MAISLLYKVWVRLLGSLEEEDAVEISLIRLAIFEFRNSIHSSASLPSVAKSGEANRAWYTTRLRTEWDHLSRFGPLTQPHATLFGSRQAGTTAHLVRRMTPGGHPNTQQFIWLER